MNYLKIDECSVCNGTGFRIVLWVSGCEHHCIGCQNPESWRFDNGQFFSQATIDKLIELLNKDYISGITLSGGDPLNPKNVIKIDTPTIYDVVREIKEKCPNKTIWIYTGYSWNELLTMSKDNYMYQYVIENSDIIVDGEYKQSCRDITLAYKGSTNQQIIDVQQTLHNNRLVLWHNGISKI